MKKGGYSGNSIKQTFINVVFSITNCMYILCPSNNNRVIENIFWLFIISRFHCNQFSRSQIITRGSSGNIPCEQRFRFGMAFSIYEVVCFTVSQIVGLSFSRGHKQTNYTTDSNVNDFINAKSHAGS